MQDDVINIGVASSVRMGSCGWQLVRMDSYVAVCDLTIVAEDVCVCLGCWGGNALRWVYEFSFLLLVLV